MPTYTISPEEIFQGKVLLFDVNFFETNKKEIKEKWGDKKDDDGNVVKDSKGNTEKVLEYYYYIDDKGNEVKTSKQNMAQELRGVISKWYVAIRNIALVGMMIILLYIGIRMLLSTLSSDKAKYRQMLQDWLIGILLLFLMHYIMAFSVKIVEKVTDVVGSSIDKTNFYSIIPFSDDNSKKENFIKFVKKAGLESCYITKDGKEASSSSEAAGILYPTNLMGYIRIAAELTTFGGEYIGKCICFIVLVLMTLYFVFTYLKRVLYMAFLTIIAPLVAATYPIDKITDGSAQGFSKWFKEYIFNLLIQPLHLLLYYILITSAWNLSSSNILYSLVALGFMIPAEKLLRSLFGFEKAHTPGLLAGPAGAALTMNAINSLRGKGGSSKTLGESKKNNSNSSTESQESSRSPRLESTVDESTAFGDDENTNHLLGNEETDPILTAYRNDGFMQNARGEYFNPYSDDYDPDYDPHDDQNYTALHQNNMGASNINDPNRNNPLPAGDNNNLTPHQKPKRKLKKRAGRLVRATGKKVAIKGLNAAKQMPGRAIRFTGNVAGHGIRTALSAGTLGALGLAAGIVSGDPNKAFQYATAATVAGKSLIGKNTGAVGNAVADKLESAIPALGRIDDPNAKYQEVLNNRRYEELNNDDYIKGQRKEIQKALNKNFNKKEVKAMMDNGTVDKYINEHVDTDDIVTAERMRKEDSSMTLDQAIMTTKYAKSVGSNYEGPEAERWQASIANKIQKKTGRSEAQSNKLAETAMNRVAKFNKTKKTNYK